MRRAHNQEKKEGESKNQVIVIAVDNDKGSQHALKWAADHVVGKGQACILLHVRRKLLSIPTPTGKQVPISEVDEDIVASFMDQMNIQTKEVILPYQCFCRRRGIQCKEVVLEDMDIPNAIIDYITRNSVDKIVFGASSRNAFTRTFKSADVPTTVSKSAPDFCTVYVVSKGKLSYIRPGNNQNKSTLKRQSSVKSVTTEVNLNTSSTPTPTSSSLPPSSNSFQSSTNSFQSSTNSFQSSLNSFQSSSSSYQQSPSNSITGGSDARNHSDETIKCPFSRIGNGYNRGAAVAVAVAPRSSGNRNEGFPTGSQFGGALDLSFQSGSSSPARSSVDMLSTGIVSSPGRESVDRMSITSIDRPGISAMRDHIDGGGRQSRMPNMYDFDKNSYYSNEHLRSYESSRGGSAYWSSGSGSSGYDTSSVSQDGAGSSWSRQSLEEVEMEMRRLKLELQQTLDMYNNACKGALYAKQKDMYDNFWKMEEESGSEDAGLTGKAAFELAEKEKQRCKEMMEAAQAAQRMAEREASKRLNGERKLLQEGHERRKDREAHSKEVLYRKYTKEEIERATNGFSDALIVGEGGYGPVFKTTLDHTLVAIKSLRADASQGMKQFQQELEVLSCIRHPNMVLLLGACPDNGCLVYEYMSNGSLEDCLFRQDNQPPLSWQLRFKIASEIATGLLFLHQNKPEPLVHRDLKPANILLDHNFVSKISDVGLARLVPPSVANQVTQYHMTAAAGTFCYIDPEYQMTGMLGIKSDIYALGIILLQLITAKPPMGLSHNVERAIERGSFADMLDPSVIDWPLEETLNFAKLALNCAELRKKDRPDLGTVVLPELNRLRALADQKTRDRLLQQPGISMYGRN